MPNSNLIGQRPFRCKGSACRRAAGVAAVVLLAALAWLKNARYAGNVERAIKFLAETCKAGRFGSTQSTVLALRANCLARGHSGIRLETLQRVIDFLDAGIVPVNPRL